MRTTSVSARGDEHGPIGHQPAGGRHVAPAPAGAPRLFRAGPRRAALVWVAATLPLVVVAGLLTRTVDQYIVVFAVLASGLYTTPALVGLRLAAKRAPHPDTWCWRLWLVAVGLMYATGCAMVLGTITDIRTSVAVNAAVIAVTSLLLMAGVVVMVRSRSGRRATSVDLIESTMSVIVVVAPAALVWGDDVAHADDAWYAVPAAVATAAMVFGTYWAVLLFVRVRRESRSSRMIATVGIALTASGLVNGVGQVAQGVTGFALPAAPLLALQAVCMSLLLFVPLFVPGRISPGLDRLPPHVQVRGAWLPAALMLVGMPALVLVTLAQRGEHAWAPLYSLCVAAVLLVLGSLRQLAAASETRRLHRRIEEAAETRRELLAQVMQRSDDERHRVAAQLHEQAVSAYSTFVSFIQTSTLIPAGGGGTVAGASALVRDGLREQAESLRRLMLAVQPLEVDRPRSQSLSAPIHAYVDGLYGDGAAPTRVVRVDGDLVLDWATETVVLRIVQEAVRNVWRHSRATRIDVSVRASGPAVEVVIADDGVGFDPSALLFESGIAAMRSFAVLGHGVLDVDSAPGAGTRVTARLGDPGAAADEAGGEAGRPELRLLRGATSVGEA